MFLPISKQDLIERGIEQVDFVYVSGDAYVDHPSFGTAIISRVLDANGFIVAILPQPQSEEEYCQFGTPRLGFLVSSGNIDSIVNHYAVSKHPREKDAYSEGGKTGMRPDYAVTVYCKTIRKLYKDIPIIIGGVEASLRRLTHYDYYQNRLFKSILIDSGADIISYGMGEQSILDICEALRSGLDIKDIIYVKGTVWKTKDKNLLPSDGIYLPSHKEQLLDKKVHAKAFKIQYDNTDPYQAKPLIELIDNEYVIQNTPTMPFTQEFLDWVYSLDYERTYHPIYKQKVPAIEEVKYSIAINRGCMGSCSFCALTFHQGRIIQARSKDSVIEEAKKITSDPDFKGYIHDIGGPTANFYVQACKQQETKGACINRRCLFPNKCPNLTVSHKEYLEILRSVRNLPKIKKVFIRSGIRYDYLIYDNDPTFFEELVQYHISGQLKVAPEHVSDNVLKYMQKPPRAVYEKFVKKYKLLNEKFKKDQFLVPYLMSSHPGSTLKDAIELAEYLHENRIRVDQVQDFYPTPGTLSTCMYYTKIDPRTSEEVYVATSPHEKALQRALIQYSKPNNYFLVKEALTKANRLDLIGNGPKCLIPYNPPYNNKQRNNYKKPTKSLK